MTVDKNEIHRDRLRTSVALTGACAALVLGTARAETYIEPHIGFDLTWTDNVALAPPGTAKRDELIGQLKPGITIGHEGRNLQAFLDYELQAMYFQDQADSQVFHQGDLGIQFQIVPDWFFVDLGGSRSQTVVDPRQPINVGNMFQTGNLADSTSGQVSPIIRHKFRLVELEASYTRGFLKYSQADTIEQTTPTTDLSFDDSQNQSANFSLRSADPDAVFTWDATYRHDKVDYDLAQTFEYDQAYLELGFLVGRGFRLIAQGGKETDPIQDVSTGGLQESSYKGGFEWREGERNLVRALMGHRFFGTTYEGMWRYTGRVLESDVSYTEGPTTQTQNRVVRGITAPTDFPPGLEQDFSRTTSDVYLSKALEGRIGLRGRVTEVFLTANWERRDYILLGDIEDKYTGVGLELMRRLGPRVTLTATAGYIDTQLREGDAYKDHNYALSLVRQIGNKTQLTLTGNRIDRTGGAQPYAANWVLLGIEVNFAGNDRAGGRGFGAGGRPATRGNTLPTIPRR
jgi:hypothetical protein